jgi:hypothetical protein
MYPISRTKYVGGLNRKMADSPTADDLDSHVNEDQKDLHHDDRSATVDTQNSKTMHDLDEFGIRDPMESLRGLSSDNHRTDNEVNNPGSSESDQKGNIDDTYRSAEKSIYGIESLGSELDLKIPGRDYAEFVIGTIKQTVKKEDSLVRLIVYTAISKDTSNPINLAVLTPTSEGKTYAVLESIQYFPKQDIWKIGSMTPKVIIRQNGILVDSNNQPLETRIKELKRKIKETDYIDEKEDLKQQLSQLYNEAKVLIDLRGKLWVFLEPPHRETWAILKPILSHDDFEIEHPYVYEVEGMGSR